ncbi:MAG: methionyl-tRNA formyltransferase [Verrucomicrobiota bacterium]|nr:methionyl-tRNA formyltransferase [Verrucomicrobiota bacterium]
MRVLFIGTGEIGVPTLRTLLQSQKHELIGAVTQPDKPVGRAQRIEPPAIKKELAQTGLPILQPERLRDPDAVELIGALGPDIIVVMAYGQILPKSVLEIPQVACLNLHASLLPRHRGAAPIQAAIVAGEAETGITVMYMDEGLDTGDILLQEKLALAPNETGGSLHDRLADLAPEAILRALDLLGEGKAPRQPQDAVTATYAAKLTREHGKIDWKEPAETIEQKIRAFDPWPGAFTQLADSSDRIRNLKIFRASVAGQDLGAPGTIVQPNDSEVFIATGRGALRLDEVQLEGKRRLKAADFLRGFSSPRLHF